AQRRLLAEVIRLGERLRVDVALEDHRLDDPGAVAHLEEVQLPAGPLSVEPAAQLHFLVLELPDFADRSHWNGHGRGVYHAVTPQKTTPRTRAGPGRERWSNFESDSLLLRQRDRGLPAAAQHRHRHQHAADREQRPAGGRTTAALLVRGEIIARPAGRTGRPAGGAGRSASRAGRPARGASRPAGRSTRSPA